VSKLTEVRIVASSNGITSSAIARDSEKIKTDSKLLGQSSNMGLGPNLRANPRHTRDELAPVPCAHPPFPERAKSCSVDFSKLVGSSTGKGAAPRLRRDPSDDQELQNPVRVALLDLVWEEDTLDRTRRRVHRERGLSRRWGACSHCCGYLSAWDFL
jgi:hypothetical protein